MKQIDVKPLNTKLALHPRNKHRQRYNFDQLIQACPSLAAFVKLNQYHDASIDFSNANAVKALNQALLKQFYHVYFWEIPKHYLCPAIPGRADYIHYLADLLSDLNSGTIPTGDKITCLDIGVGASCIYPILGIIEYDWNFIGTDIDPKSINTAKKIADSNSALKNKVECRLQEDKIRFFDGIITKGEYIDATLCNPPFHSSFEEAHLGTQRKIKNLTGKKVHSPELNFSGISNELVCEGGEYQFIKNMIIESIQFSKNCLWFSTLVSKHSHLKGIYSLLKKMEAMEIKTIPMGTGNKSSRIVAWTFLSKKEQIDWRKSRWSD